jgi:hypothetical protein
MFDGKLHNDNKVNRHASYQDRKTRTNQIASHTNTKINSTQIKVDDAENLGHHQNQQSANEEKIAESSIIYKNSLITKSYS